MDFDIPGHKNYSIEHVVFDLNGTLAVDGVVDEEVKACLKEICSLYSCHIITAGTHGGLDALQKELDIHMEIIEEGREAEKKRMFVASLGSRKTAAIGNGANDRGMLEEADLGIAICSREGMSPDLVKAADIIVTDIRDAFDLLLKPKRIVATLRS